MYERFGLYLNGKWQPAASGKTFPVVDPATEEPIGEAPCAGRQETVAAIASAQSGLEIWRYVRPWERADVIRRIGELLGSRADEIARILTLEVGKPLAQSKNEIHLACDQFAWFSEETKRIYGQTVESRLPDSRVLITHEPVGVVAAFTAWNYPILLMARKIAPALAAGCSIICRPSSEAPGASMMLIQCCHDAGLPPGVVSLLSGQASEISSAIMEAPAVRKVSLTGSIEVGKRLLRQAADTVKRVSMELGGHAPVIVFDDVDAEAVAELSAQVKFKCSGQVCVSPSRFYVHERQVNAFAKRFADVASCLRIGSGFDAEVDLGPLTTKGRLDQIEALVEDTKDSGAKLLVGGKRPPNLNRGYFYEPTVFGDVPRSARVMQEEIFGPIVPITTFTEQDDVLEQANALPLGLASYVFTRSLKRAHEVSAALQAGMVGVNTYALASAETPFGGIKESGYGREGGAIGINDYLNVKYTNFVLT